MFYQRKILPSTLIGGPAPLPAELVGLSDECLADLSASVPQAAQQLGYAGQGFFPVEEPSQPPPPPPPTPPPTTVLKSTQFLSLFTMAEVILIKQTAKTNTTVDYYQYMLDSAKTLSLNSKTVIDGVNSLEAFGLIAQGRAAQILANQPPVDPEE